MADDTKLGSAGDPFRALLFADQSLDTLFKLPHNPSPSKNSPLTLFEQAHKQMTAGESEAARTTLRKVLSLPEAETRHRLWAWTSLRELRDVPDQQLALDAQGVVLEVPLKSGVDTVAAYADGTARYINYSGKVVIWDTPDPLVKQLCMRSLAAAQPLVPHLPTKTGHAQPTGDTAFLTVLTFSGNREGRFQLSKASYDREFSPVFSAVTELMVKLTSSVSRPTQSSR